MATVEQLPDEEEFELDDDEDAFSDEDFEDTEDDLDPADNDFVERLVDRIIVFQREFTQVNLFPYQIEVVRGICRSILRGDGATLTIEQSRQSGKTEEVADTLAVLMVLLPRLAKAFPDFEPLQKFLDGVMVGTFAPVESQAETLYSRIVSRLTSDHAIEIMLDPEIDEVAEGGGKLLKLKRSGSFCRMQTANPKAKIESKSYHIIVIDECQEADEFTVNKSIFPMGAFYNATKVLLGTPAMNKGVFYKTIQLNKRVAARKGKGHHYRFDWKDVAKFNKDYARFVKSEMRRLGEDSDEFQLSYAVKWLLERGMFITEQAFEALCDPSMQIVRSWFVSPVLVGVDPARRKDSTVVTVLWVDWDYPDEFGLYECRILNWLELTGDDWETQYAEIVNFLAPYHVAAVAVDANGMGGPVAERLAVLLPYSEVHLLESDQMHQSKRWKHLLQLVQRGMIGWPGHSKAKRLKVWKRFNQQMIDLEKNYHGQYLLAEAPNETEAHDDFPDSCALAAYLTSPEMGVVLPEVEVSESPFVARRR